MSIEAESKVADIAVAHPESIRVFQKHGIDFCCGGKVPLRDACRNQGLDTAQVLAELRAVRPDEDAIDWSERSLRELTTHIRARYHEPLRGELARLATMLARVLDRHGERLPATLVPLRATFEAFHRDLIDHMGREDAILFPLIDQVESAGAGSAASAPIRMIVTRMSAEHDAAGEALAAMRRITDGYVPPTWACPTFLGLYHGLAELERQMQDHVHLENAILFPRAAAEDARSIALKGSLSPRS